MKLLFILINYVGNSPCDSNHSVINYAEYDIAGV